MQRAKWLPVMNQQRDYQRALKERARNRRRIYWWVDSRIGIRGKRKSAAAHILRRSACSPGWHCHNCCSSQRPLGKRTVLAANGYS